jgi:hypothetical protein
LTQRDFQPLLIVDIQPSPKVNSIPLGQLKITQFSRLEPPFGLTEYVSGDTNAEISIIHAVCTAFQMTTPAASTDALGPTPSGCSFCYYTILSLSRVRLPCRYFYVS